VSALAREHRDDQTDVVATLAKRTEKNGRGNERNALIAAKRECRPVSERKFEKCSRNKTEGRRKAAERSGTLKFDASCVADAGVAGSGGAYVCHSHGGGGSNVDAGESRG